MAEQAFQFALKRITTEQFATVGTTAPTTPEIGMEVGLRFGRSLEQRLVLVFVKFTFIDDGKPFLIAEACCTFEITAETWEQHMKGGEMIARQSLSHLVTLTVGTTRGILHAKTENTPFNQFFIPTINVWDMIPEDYYFEEHRADNEPI